MGNYTVENGVYTKLPGTYVVENGVYTRLLGAYVVENGVYVKLWRTSDTISRFVAAIRGTYASNTITGTTTVDKFLLLEDYRDTTDFDISTSTSDIILYNHGGYSFLEKTLFIGSTNIVYFSKDSTICTLKSTSAFPSHDTLCRSVDGRVLCAITSDTTITGGNTTGESGYKNLYLIFIDSSLNVTNTKLTGTVGQSGDTKPMFTYSSSADGTQSSETNWFPSNPIIYNNKLYFLLTGYTYLGNSSSGGTEDNHVYLRYVDLSDNTLKDSVYDFEVPTYSSGYSKAPQCFTYTLSFSDGMLLFVNNSIYKLNTNGTSVTKLTDFYTSSYLSAGSTRIIRINPTVFAVVINYTATGGAVHSVTKVYEFKNGNLTLLKNLGSTNITHILNSNAINGVLVASYSKTSTSYNTSTDNNVLYSLDYGETWTSNIVNTSISGLTANNTMYHIVAQDIY